MEAGSSSIPRAEAKRSTQERCEERPYTAQTSHYSNASCTATTTASITVNHSSARVE